MRTNTAPLSLSLLAATLLSGCAMNVSSVSPGAPTSFAVQGNVHGGQQPVSGAHVYLMAASTTGYGTAATSLLVPSSTGNSDSNGGYVLTAKDGSFTLTGEYTCTASTQIYVYVVGGNPGAGPNSAAGFLSALGQCPDSGSLASSNPFVYINEVTTVAAAYAMAGYAADATHVGSSGTPLAQTGISNAFANAANLVNSTTGAALLNTPATNGTAPQRTVNTLANILAACVNSTGPTSLSCTTLFANARSNGSTGTLPTDTATAAINIAHNPGANVQTLYFLSAPAAAFSPSLTTPPNDYTLGINYSGAGVAGSGFNGAYSVALDQFGSAWFVNINNNSVSKLSAQGEPQSPASGFTSGSQVIPSGIAIDLNQNAWVSDAASNNLTEFSPNGTLLSPAGGFSGGGLAAPQAVMIDGVGNVWAVNYANNSLSKFSSAGVALSPSTGFTGGGINSPTSLIIDGNGSVWVPNQQPGPGSLSKFSSAGVAQSPATGFLGGGLNNPFSAAVDSNGNVWVANYGGNSISEFTSAGVPVSPSTGFMGGGLSLPYSIAVDGGNNVWVVNSGNNSVSEFTSAGLPMSPATGYTGGTINGPDALAVDESGDVWIANTDANNGAAVTELIGASVPSARPLAVNIKDGTLGARP